MRTMRPGKVLDEQSSAAGRPCRFQRWIRAVACAQSSENRAGRDDGPSDRSLKNISRQAFWRAVVEVAGKIGTPRWSPFESP